jgi:hypothetical protein
MEKNEIVALLDKHEITLQAKFVPWSQSRNFDPANVKHPENKSLNWKVTLLYRNRPVIETDYMAGIGHSPAYKDARKIGRGVSLGCEAAINGEVETGYRHKYNEAMDWTEPKRKELLLPDTCDVIHSLLLDGNAIDHPSFEDWASDFGYDTDSRKAETMYRACLDIGLKLRASLGDELLRELRDAFQDY